MEQLSATLELGLEKSIFTTTTPEIGGFMLFVQV